MLIVDSHTHLLPLRLARAIRRWFDEHLPPSMPLVYPVDIDQVCSRLKVAGIGRCWSLPYAHRAGMAAELNGAMAQTFAGDPFVVPGATVHPEDDVEQVVEHAHQRLGLKLFKIHCAVGGFGPDDPRLDPLWSKASDWRSPVVIHLGRSPFGTTDAEEVQPLRVVARRFPEVRLIVAHLGSPAVEATIELMRDFENVHADLTPVVFSRVEVDPQKLSPLSDRLLFGSDAPNTGIPVEEGIAQVRSWGLSSNQTAAILGGNALRLIA